MTGVYVLHFDRAVADHAAHYIGWAKDVDQRIDTHRQGNGARLVAVARELGIGFTVAAVFPFPTAKAAREHERYLKHTRKNGRSVCPLCRPALLERKRQPRGSESPAGADTTSEITQGGDAYAG